MVKKLPGLIVLIIGLLAVYFLFRGNMVVGIVGLVVSVFAGLYLLGRSEEKNEAKEAEMNKLKLDENGGYGHLSGDTNPNFDKAKQVREEMMKNIVPDDTSLDINAAAELMLNKDFEGSIKAYERTMEKYPERKGTCLVQIGVAEFFLGNYEKALEKYIEAKDCGEDNDMTEDNIWEACETIYKQKGTKEYIEKYTDLYPQGRYIKKANKLVS